jgi:hypothetical protein
MRTRMSGGVAGQRRCSVMLAVVPYADRKCNVRGRSEPRADYREQSLSEGAWRFAGESRRSGRGAAYSL